MTWRAKVPFAQRKFCHFPDTDMTSGSPSMLITLCFSVSHHHSNHTSCHQWHMWEQDAMPIKRKRKQIFIWSVLKTRNTNSYIIMFSCQHCEQLVVFVTAFTPLMFVLQPVRAEQRSSAEQTMTHFTASTSNSEQCARHNSSMLSSKYKKKNSHVQLISTLVHC